jgi:AP-1 complex subunit gamma-1
MDEQSEVLLLTANQIKKDLDSSNQLIVSMALNAIGEICTTDMCREVAVEVGKLMTNTNPYIKKKGALAAVKILRKCPEFVDSFVSKLSTYFEEKNHGVLLSGISLALQIFKIDKDYVKKFTKYNNFLLKYLKVLLSVTYSPEYDVNGITDPFLQVKILEMLAYFGSDSKELSEDMNDILASVATNTEVNRNVGNAVLYELVKTIMSIKSSSGLRSIGSNILGKLLSSKDNNYKYIALNTLQAVSKVDLNAVQKHKNVILECLKDLNDISIKRRAFDLIFVIINTSNIKQIMKECLNFLINGENEFKLDLTTKVIFFKIRYSIV